MIPLDKFCKYVLLILIISIQIDYFVTCSSIEIKRRQIRHAVSASKGVKAPVISDEIDMDTIEGVEQVTKLVLIKTDSLPDASDEGIDGRYLNSLMETLYTGLRKPFKSVSADILGIFPSLEEIKVRCDKQPNTSEHLEKDESVLVKRNVTNKITNMLYTSDTYSLYKQVVSLSSKNDDNGPAQTVDDYVRRKESNVNIDADSSNDISPAAYKSPLQVCQAVTDDCLSMDNLIQILPPSITTFDKALVRLCPIMLFRIMNQLCDKYTSQTNTGDKKHDEIISVYSKAGKLGGGDDTELLTGNKNDNLNTLLRETKILKNLQNSDDLGSKKPQKLHKKLKTTTIYGNKNGNGRLNPTPLQQHGTVDEQLLKIRLKLTEPSIEKVWIFSLLFVILSIVVSMGGLIVLPFVKKTTRRRILTLFEGLAVGGLAGSATLHMFPQAFGLVDENYHKYFWRIFVVFFGIYLCYLCERIIKIVKVMRARMKRRSRASLIDMDFCYGFPSVSREISRNAPSKIGSRDFYHADLSNSSTKKRISRVKLTGSKERTFSSESTYRREKSTSSKLSDNSSKRKSRRLSRMKQEVDGMFRIKRNKDIHSIEPEIIGDLDANQSETRQRLVECLRSVQEQFSPVYAVENPQPVDNMPVNESRAGRLMRMDKIYNQGGKKKMKKESTRSRVQELPNSVFGINHLSKKSFLRKQRKQKDPENANTLYQHDIMKSHQLRPNQRSTFDRGYLQHRLTTVKDVATKRQDQDNAARMSVDTVAWMIVFGDAVLNVIDGLSIGAAFERNILAGISISVAVMLEEVTHRLGTFAVLIRAGMSMQQSLLCTFVSACALFPGLIVGILLSDATEDATPYIFCAAGGIFLYMALVDVMKEMNRSIENAIRKDIKSTLQIFALQNVGIILAVIFLSFLALYEQAMDFEEYQIQYNQPSSTRDD